MKRLREWLDSTGTTQAALAAQVGVKPPTVSQWLDGLYSPGAGRLIDLSRVTGLSIEQLLEGTVRLGRKRGRQAQTAA